MNILILGSGGREHAMAWKIKQSTHCQQLYVAPGNAGTQGLAVNVDLNVNDFEAQVDFCKKNKIDLLLVGPEDPLVAGVYDYFQKHAPEVQVIGPSAHGAQLEGSKSFSKKFMQRHQIPTATYASFTHDTVEEGRKYLLQHSLPIVLKADGLAAGKGVVIAATHEEALATFEEMIVDKKFGSASEKVVIEQFLEGIELSVFVLTDGIDYKIIGHAKDYKRIFEGDKGPNTGGMGCVTPVPFATSDFMQKVENAIIKPTINGLKEEGIDYKGFIFFGLIKVNDAPFVIEYNARMGDPETEVVLPRLKTDIVSLFLSMKQGKLSEATVTYDPLSLATIVAVSKGYPGKYEKGKIIEISDQKSTSIIFHAGTARKDGILVSNGGRVLSITSYGHSIVDAVENSKAILQNNIHFEGMNYRKDIGYEFE